MGINLNCPECGKRMTFSLASTEVSCPHCGYQRDTGLDRKIEEVRAKGPRPEITISNEQAINARAVSLFHTAHDRLFDDDKAGAVAALREALDIQPDFLDAHLWMAKISDDETVKRDHLSSILAYDPGHVEATRQMMVLNGRLTPEQARQSHDERSPILQVAEEAVNTAIISLCCPNCGGDVSTNEAATQVECRFCGHIIMVARSNTETADSFLAAMLERRTQSIEWEVGERLLHCNECGAERAVPGNTLSTRCPFCGSNQVIEQDALESFVQPDGILPFTISREEAGQRIKQQLKQFSERLKGWFDDNRVASATLNGFYLPFWVFDAQLQINRTRIDNTPNLNRYRPQTSVAQAYQRSTFDEALYDVAVCAVKSPPPAMTQQLGTFHTGELLDYNPALIVKYPAQIYSLNFDGAALEARSRIAGWMREKYGQRQMNDDDGVSINVFSNIRAMQFRLALMPVWIAHLVEVDQDRRVALVNGQTGQVVLGKTEKGS